MTMPDLTDEKRQRDLTCITDQKIVVQEMIESIVKHQEILREFKELRDQVYVHAQTVENHASLISQLNKSFDDFKRLFGSNIDSMTAANKQQNVKLNDIQTSQKDIKIQLEILSPFIDKAKWIKAAKWPLIINVVLGLTLLLSLDSVGKIQFIKAALGLL